MLIAHTPFGPNLFSGPVVERMRVVAGCFAVEAKSTFRDRSKPECAGNDNGRCDDRESQNKVSEEVHYWRIARRYPLLKKLAKRKKARSSPEGSYSSD